MDFLVSIYVTILILEKYNFALRFMYTFLILGKKMVNDALL